MLELSQSGGGTVTLSASGDITCSIHTVNYKEWPSIHALLVPEGVSLDLSGRTLRLDLASNGYGVRLARSSAIKNGTVKVVRSEGAGSQAIWHSAISIGAAFGDGGTPSNPSYFSDISNWLIENVTVDQPFAHEAIAGMSEAHHGTIRGVHILSSAQVLIGIGFDAGAVGPITSADAEQARMRQLWLQGSIYSTHPHDILIENITVDSLSANLNDDHSSALRLSGTHNITIRNVTVEQAALGFVFTAGDIGYEYAPNTYRGDPRLSGVSVDGFTIRHALRKGMVIDGLADNIYRAIVNHGYDAFIPPAQPGIRNLSIRNVVLDGAGPSQPGIFVRSVTNATFDHVTIRNAPIGIEINDWVQGFRFSNGSISASSAVWTRTLPDITTPAQGVVFENTTGI